MRSLVKGKREQGWEGRAVLARAASQTAGPLQLYRSCLLLDDGISGHQLARKVEVEGGGGAWQGANCMLLVAHLPGGSGRVGKKAGPVECIHHLLGPNISKYVACGIDELWPVQQRNAACIGVHACMLVCVCVFVRARACVRACMRVHSCKPTCVCVHTYRHTYGQEINGNIQCNPWMVIPSNVPWKIALGGLIIAYV